MTRWDSLLEQSRRDLDFRLVIIAEETKKAGLLLAAIGVLLGILFNLFFTQQQIAATNSTINSTIQNFTFPGSQELAVFVLLFDFHIILAIAALLMVSAFCLVTVLVKSTHATKRWSRIDYQNLQKNASFEDEEKFKGFLIGINQESISSYDNIIGEIQDWYLEGVFAFLVSLFLITFILILVLIKTSSLNWLITVLIITGLIAIIWIVAKIIAHFMPSIKGLVERIADAISHPNGQESPQNESGPIEEEIVDDP